MKTNTSAPFAEPVTSWWTRRSPKSLRWRLALLAGILIGMAQVAVSIGVYVAIASWLTTQFDQNLITVSSQVAATISSADDFDEEEIDRADLSFELSESGIASETFLREQLFFIRAVDFSTGDVLDASADFDDIAVHPPSGMMSLETFALSDEDGAAVRVYTVRFEENPRFGLQVGQSFEGVQQIQVQIQQLALLAVLLAAGLAAVSGWFLAHRALVPIRLLTVTAQEIGEHDLTRRITMPLADDELGQLSATFNRMLDRIESAFQRQKQFTADAAHELRTPLGILQTGLDVALDRPRTADAYRDVLESLQAEVGRMTKLTTSLLMLARSDSQQFTLHPQPTDLSLLMQVVSEQMELAAEDKQVQIERAIPPDIRLAVDPDWMTQMLLNLLDNAVKYTPAGGRVHVSLSRDAEKVTVQVSDTGIGIPREHLDHIFDRFYRVDRARARQFGGFGLGLAMVRQIVHLHGGQIAVSSEVGRGTAFTITLPTS